MFIIRTINGKKKKITLTNDELYLAHKEYILNFMINTLINDFDLDIAIAKEIAVESYVIYSKGDGKTEYESIKCAYDKYLMESQI